MRGKLGESIVSNKLDRLPKDQYKVLNNVTIPTPKGSSQIDHLIVSIFGIFVIETKNLKGWIYGGEHSEYWTQNIYGNKYQLYNPILQNAGHVRALRRVLKEYEPLAAGRIFIVGGIMTPAVIMYFLLGCYRPMIWVAAISAVAWYFTKPTLAKMDKEMTPEDPNIPTY